MLAALWRFRGIKLKLSFVNSNRFCKVYASTEGAAGAINTQGKVGAVGFIPLTIPVSPLGLVKMDEDGGIDDKLSVFNKIHGEYPSPFCRCSAQRFRHRLMHSQSPWGGGLVGQQDTLVRQRRTESIQGGWAKSYLLYKIIHNRSHLAIRQQ